MTPSKISTLAAVAFVALAGCSTVDSLTAEAELTYDGSKNGSHSDKAACDAEGSLKGSGTIHDGDVVVEVKDGDGTTLFRQSFEGSFELTKTRLDGHSGTWTLSAVRGGDDVIGDAFHGKYGFFLDCKGL